jgi:hypothetical protein
MVAAASLFLVHTVVGSSCPVAATTAPTSQLTIYGCSTRRQTGSREIDTPAENGQPTSYRTITRFVPGLGKMSG